MKPEAVTRLTGRILREKTIDGTTKRLISENEFEDLLLRVFGIKEDEGHVDLAKGCSPSRQVVWREIGRSNRLSGLLTSAHPDMLCSSK